MEARHPAIYPSHPGPKRAAVSRWALGFGLLAAPLAWSLDEIGSYILAANACELKASGDATLMIRGSSPAYIALTAVTWLIALAGLWVALQNWRKTRDEHPGGGHHLVALGEGRTRFVSMCGLMASIAFTLGFLYLTLQVFAAPLCEP
ncbi:MAG: hypothetical protein ACXWC4_02095 [Telluria sp.]